MELRPLRGVIRSSEARLAHRVALASHPLVASVLAAHVAGTAALPDVVDHGPLAPGQDQGGVDQGDDGCCVPSSGEGALVTAFAAQGQPLPFVPGIRVSYAGVRALARAHANPLGPYSALSDSGSEIADLLDFYARYGVVDRLLTPGLVKGLTPDGRFHDAWSAADLADAGITGTAANLNDECDFGLLLKAARKLVVGPYGVDPAQANVSDILAAALVSGIPSQLAFLCDSVFQGLQAGQVAPAPNTADTTAGGHAVYLNGYLTVTTAALASQYKAPIGTRLFWLQNSWSTGWCDHGRTLVGPAWLAAAWEAHPIAVVKQFPATMKEAA